jgi:hypothetical protein
MDQQPEDIRAIMTVLEGHVAPDQWATLAQIFTAAGDRLPPQMLQTVLVQGTSDPTLWRGISIWRSRAALDEYRRSVETPGGVLMFRAAGAEPSLSIFEVVTDRHQ